MSSAATTTTGSPEPDPREVLRFAEIIAAPAFADGHVIELRALGTSKATVSGYFDDLQALTHTACRWSGDADSVYLCLNPAPRDLLARSCNRGKTFAKNTTSDKETVCRNWLLIDFDPVRFAGISATDHEREAAHVRARAARDFLFGLDWPAPLYGDSGNGAHLIYRVNLPNNRESERLLQQSLEALGAHFDDDVVKVDRTTFNASRLCKCYGTAACKGDSVPDLGRVHRIARLLDVPAELLPVNFTGQEVAA